ncbi:MAG: hypothetical protein ABI042_11520 [Verrucomicrobiota bacterium]
MNDAPKRDWEETWVHFFCGALVGAGLGFYLSFQFSENNSWQFITVFIVAGALLIGFLAAFFLDGFWEKFLEWFRWW